MSERNRRVNGAAAVTLLLALLACTSPPEAQDRARADSAREAGSTPSAGEPAPVDPGVPAAGQAAQERGAAVYLLAAQTALAEGDPDAAVVAARRSLAYLESPSGRAVLDEALRAAAAASPQDALSVATRAEAAGDLEAARTSYARAAALDPTSEVARAGVTRVSRRIRSGEELGRRARRALRAGDLEQAERLASDGIEQYPGEAASGTVLATVAAEYEARVAEAAAQAARAAENWEAAVELSRRAVEARTTASRVTFVKSVERSAARAYRNRADAAFAAGRFYDAVRFYERAAALGDDGPRLRRSLQRARSALDGDGP